MGLLRKHFEKHSSYWTRANSWFIPAALVGAGTHHVAATNIPAVGASVAMTNAWTRGLHSVLITTSLNGGTITTVTFRVSGYDQFGDLVSEDVNFTGAAAKWTKRAYSRIVSLTVVGTKTTTGSPQVSVGYGTAVANGFRVASMVKSPSAGLVKAVMGSAGMPQTSVTVDSANSAIEIAGSNADSSTWFLVHLDPKYAERT
jgi:hypothetical protein